MSNVDYKGSVTLISGLTQANNSSFPLVDGDAVQYKQEINEDGTFKSVSQKLSEFNRSYEYATSDDIDGILNGLFGQWKRLSLTEDTMLENTFEDQLKILSVSGNSYQPTSNNIVPTPEKPIPIISKKTNIKRISPNIFDLEKESDTSKIPDSGTYRSVGQHQLKANTKYVFSWSGATVPTKATLSFQIQDDKGTVLASPFTYFNLESAEKEEAGKEVEFTTNSSGIVKFAYNCTVGTSNTKETYQQYWYTKILKDITLKEDAEYESEYVELRSLKETGNLFDKNIHGFKLGFLRNTGEVGDINTFMVSDYIAVNPNTKYIYNLVDGFRNSTKLCFDQDKNVVADVSSIAFTTPANCYYVRYQIAANDSRALTEEDIKNANDNTMFVEGESLPSTYIPPTIRDYKIVDHKNKTSKIIRNVGVVNLNDIKWNYGDRDLNHIRLYGNAPAPLKYVTQKTYCNIFESFYEKFNYNKQGIYCGNVSGGTTISVMVNSSVFNGHGQDEFDRLFKEYINNPNAITLYPLATSIEEQISYIETDTSEVGYSWQDNTSPSPTIPSQIEGVNEIDVTVTGKNMFDLEKAKDRSSWVPSIIQVGYSDFMIKVIKGKQYTFSYDSTLNTGIGFYAGIVINQKDIANSNMSKWFYHSDLNSLIINKHTFLATEDYVSLRINNKGIDTALEHLKNLQLEVGDTATAYEPYKPLQSLSYQLDTPLKGINNTKDIIDIESNQRTDNLTIFVLDDKTTKSIIVGTTKEKTQVFQLDISDIFNDNDIWCDKLKNDRNKDEELFTCQSGNLYIAIYKGRLETVDVAGFKKWLKDNPLTFTGSATTPTQEILPEDLPAKLNKLKTNDGSTVIYINGEVKPSLNIEYKGT